MNRCNHRIAVVLIQTRQAKSPLRQVSTLGNTLPGLKMSLQGSSENRIKSQTSLTPIVAKLNALLATTFAELVVVLRAKRSLAVADKVKGSHGRIFG